MESAPTQPVSARSYWLGPVFSELLIALLPLLTYHAIVASRLPELVAVHFNENGIPDRLADKNSLEVFLLLTAGGIFGLLFGKILRVLTLSSICLTKNENNKRLCARMMNYAEFFLVILFTFTSLEIQKTSMGQDLNMELLIKAVCIGMNILFILLANICPKIAPNKWVGIRTPFAFSSNEAWNRVQRFGSKVLFWGSLFNILATLFLPSSPYVVFAFNMASILLQTLFIILWKPKKKKTEALH